MSCELYSIGVQSASICVLICQYLNKIDGVVQVSPASPICFCVCVLKYFFVNLYLYNTALSILFCVNKDLILLGSCARGVVRKSTSCTAHSP